MKLLNFLRKPYNPIHQEPNRSGQVQEFDNERDYRLILPRATWGFKTVYPTGKISYRVIF